MTCGCCQTSCQTPSTGSQQIATRLTQRLKREDAGSTEEVTPHPSRKGAQRSTSDPPRAKRPRVGTSHCQESDDDVEESDVHLLQGLIFLPLLTPFLIVLPGKVRTMPRDNDRDNPPVGE